jgi:osmoprotectant transport system permease protein
VEFFAQVVRWFTDAGHWRGAVCSPSSLWLAAPECISIPNRILEHLAMSATCILAGLVIALPVGVVLGHFGVGGVIAINLSNIGRAIPSFAILVIAVPIFGIGAAPACAALIALAIPPILTNSFVGMQQVDREIRESSRGMGMTELQVLLRIEMPLALPVIMAGVRTSGVNVVATATLAALVAWGGLGRFIVDGLSQRDFVQLFAGALLVAALSLAAEAFLALLQRLATPAGLRLAGRPSTRRALVMR